MNIITENQLDEWVRSNTRNAQGLIVELVYRLVAASCPKPKERRLPLGDSIGQTGSDGLLNTDSGFEPFVPPGKSYWEIGTGNKAEEKATDDYNSRTNSVPEKERHESTFIFVTPLSGVRGWKYPAQCQWLEDRRQCRGWQDVQIIDGTKLIDWLHHFPAVEQWLTNEMGWPADQMETLEQHWIKIKTIGELPLIPEIFLANRGKASEELRKLFATDIPSLRLDTRYPNQAADFVAAYVANKKDENEKVNIYGRSLIVTNADAWKKVIEFSESHFLMADFDPEDSSEPLFEMAKKKGHRVISRGMPGGIPHNNRVSIPNPNKRQIEDALKKAGKDALKKAGKKAGYKEAYAYNLAQKSNGNLNSLLRCLQGHPPTPAWASDTNATELAIAMLLGAWQDTDQLIVEELSEETYKEWRKKLRETIFRPDPPLVHRGKAWKFITRYEGWYVLGPRLFDEDLERLKTIAVKVLRDGKVSYLLRNGLAESLALLGNHPKALTSCSINKAETIAIATVQEILKDADWILWASLHEQLSLLAEAAPNVFLEAVENALKSNPCPFDEIFAQKYFEITGLLRALETLAWDSEQFTRVVIILGKLADRDPYGNLSNSLSTILLPWFPQTCAPIEKRQAAVKILAEEFPDVAWKVLLALLFNQCSTSGSYRPVWRETIPEDWSSQVTQQEYRKQIITYVELAINLTKQDTVKLTELIDQLEQFSAATYPQIFEHLRSDAIVSMSQTDKSPLWTKLRLLISRHRKCADATWAIKPKEINELAVIAKNLAPEALIYRHQPLFIEIDSLNDNRDEREQRLKNRIQAVKEIFATGGLAAIIEFTQSVQASVQASAGKVGLAFGHLEQNHAEKEILPTWLESEIKPLALFTCGFVSGKFYKYGWQWVDSVDISQWTPSQKGQFLAYLPFTSDTWQRSAQLLGEDESPYWSKTHTNNENEEDLERAIEHLVKYGRPYAALRIMYVTAGKGRLNNQQAIRVLQAIPSSSESPCSTNIDYYAKEVVIKTLQNDPNTNQDDLFKIEWAFLPFLNKHYHVFPKLLEQRLADDPNFFCEVIRGILAENVYDLLMQWRIPPGKKGEMFDNEAFTTWLERVKTICTEPSHLRNALLIIGHVLIHTPPDPDGLWLPHVVAKALNAKDAETMREGFYSGLINYRGVYSYTAGQEEQELAAKYDNYAEVVDNHGYDRLAQSLREIADKYKRDAQRESSENPFRDPFEN